MFMWSAFDEQYYQDLKRDYECNGNREINFNGVIGTTELLLEAFKMVRSMFNVKDAD